LGARVIAWDCITAGAMAHVTVEIEARRIALFTTGFLGQSCLS